MNGTVVYIVNVTPFDQKQGEVELVRLGYNDERTECLLQLQNGALQLSNGAIAFSPEQFMNIGRAFIACAQEVRPTGAKPQ